MAKHYSSLIQQILFLSFGIFFTAIGGYLCLNWTQIFTNIRANKMALSPDSATFPGWQNPNLTVYLNVYFFNWTNSKDFLNESIKPSFQELGPYRFREHLNNVNITWHPHNNSISYHKKNLYYFDAETSHGSLDDVVTIINPVAYSAAQQASKMNFFQRMMIEVSLSMYAENLTVTKTVDELTFTGYLDELLSLRSKFSIFSNIEPSFDRMSFFQMKNGSEMFDGDLNIFTGQDDIRKIGQINTWNNKKHNGAYPGKCGEVKGSMGQFFPPNLTPNDIIWLYVPSMCQAIPLEYLETVKVHDVLGYKYGGGKRSVDNGSLYPETKCFCVDEKCERAGVINISPCAYNSSTYMSFPHFYEADEYYINAIDGMSPVKSKHQFFITLEPVSGILLEVGGGIQTNILVEPLPQIRKYENIPRHFLPIMWCEERFRVQPEVAKDIELIPRLQVGGEIVSAVIFGVGTLMIFLSVIKYLGKVSKRKQQKNNEKIEKNKNELQKLVIKTKTAESSFNHAPSERIQCGDTMS